MRDLRNCFLNLITLAQNPAEEFNITTLSRFFHWSTYLFCMIAQGHKLQEDSTMTTEERIEKLERQNRWMKTAWAALVIGLSSFLFMCAGQGRQALPEQKVEEEMRAKRFVVVDENGETRVVLAATDDRSFLSLSDNKGRERLSLCVTGDGTGLYFNDKAGTNMINLSESGGVPALFFGDEYGRERVGLGVTKKGPSLQLRDAGGKIRVGTTVSKGDVSGFAFSDNEGKGRVFLGVEESIPRLTFFDKAGKGLIGLGVDDDGPGIGLSDKGGKLRLALSVNPRGSELVLLEEGGKHQVVLATVHDKPGLWLCDKNGYIIFEAPKK